MSVSPTWSPALLHRARGWGVYAALAALLLLATLLTVG
jgi:hypothetical protein